jgi:hypothetical protein
MLAHKETGRSGYSLQLKEFVHNKKRYTNPRQQQQKPKLSCRHVVFFLGLSFWLLFPSGFYRWAGRCYYRLAFSRQQ